MTLRSYDVQPTSTNVVTSPGLSHRDFFRYNKKNEKRKKKNKGGMEYEMEKTTKEDSRDCVILVLVFSFSNSYWIKSK